MAGYGNGGLYLTGTAAVGQYEQVLRSIRFAPQFTQSGVTRQIRVSVQVGAVESPPATTLLTVMTPPPPVVDLNGAAPGRNYATIAEVDAPPVPIVAPDGLVIEAPGLNTLLRATVSFVNPAKGTFVVDTSGTSIVAVSTTSGLMLNGPDSVDHYQAVLRSLRVSEPLGDVGETKLVQIVVAGAGSSPMLTVGPPATCFVTVVQYQPPVVDVNGPLPGSILRIDGDVNMPVQFAADVSIVSSAPMLASAQIAFDPRNNPQFAYDTSGTNITVVRNGFSLDLYGADTREHYEQFLRGLTVTYSSTPTGYTSSLEITVTTTTNVKSAPANVLVTTLQPVGPSVDLNGSAPGRDTQAMLYEALPDQPLFDDDRLSIESSHAMTLVGAQINLYALQQASASVDTSGTNIHAFTTGLGLTLSGEDTVENYEQVLRSLKFVSVNTATGTYPVRFTVTDQIGAGQSATALVTVVNPPLTLLDLDGDPDHAYFAATFRPGFGPVPIVDATGLSIESPWEVLSGGQVLGPGAIAVDTSGTNITASGSGSFRIVLSGTDTVANYERVLRTATYESSTSYNGLVRAEFVVVDPAGRPSPTVESLISQDHAPASVVGRYLFYNQSKYDGYDAAAGPADDAAIATDKLPYFAGSGVVQPTAATSYVRGINGTMIDVDNLHTTITDNDFTFKIGSSNAPDTWTTAPAPSRVLLRPGEGDGGSDRIEITWPDGAIKNTWLQVTVKGNDARGGYDTNTGLAASDVFYFGNLVGDTFVGTPPPALVTNVSDEVGVRGHSGFLLPVTNAYDFNKDMLVNVADEVIARNNTAFLLRINVPANGATPAAALVDEQPAVTSSSTVRGAAAVASALTMLAASDRRAEESRVASRPEVEVHRQTRSLTTATDEVLARARWRAVPEAIVSSEDVAGIDDELLFELTSGR